MRILQSFIPVLESNSKEIKKWIFVNMDPVQKLLEILAIWKW